MNHLAAACLDRIKTGLLPDAEGIKKFILERTRLNGRPFSLKNHEYQEKILDIVSNPNIDLVVQKPAQVGVSEIVYRVNLANMSRIPGFSSAIVFPTAKMASEVMQTRISQIISDSEPLQALRSKDVDSATVKMFANGSITYALGASANSSSSNINRPIRNLIVDEFARADLDIVTSLRSRQRHQDYRSSIYFSTPLILGADIDAEMEKCGVIWEQLFSCSECKHQFFPDFFQHVTLPGFSEEIKFLRQEDVDMKDLNLEDAYLRCPSCGKRTSYEHHQVTWIDTAEAKTRPKIGVKLSAFSMPHYVTVPDMVRDLLAYSDRAEFTQQVLGRPAETSDTTLDTSKIVFERQDAGTINVFGVDVGNICTIAVGTVLPEGRLYIHTVRFVPIRDVETELALEVAKHRCVAGVIDYMPNTVLSVRISNKFPNTWVASYAVPTVPTVELLKLKSKESEGLGLYRDVTINKNPYMDTFCAKVMSGEVTFRSSEQDDLIKAHFQAMHRLRDRTRQGIQYVWVKAQGNKTQDHAWHASIYCNVAANLINYGTSFVPNMELMVRGFKLRSEV